MLTHYLTLSNTVKIKATTDADVAPPKDHIQIINKDTKQVVKKCITGTDCTYSYVKQDYAKDPTFYAETTNLNSNTVQAVNDTPSLNLTSSYTEVQQNDYFSLGVKIDLNSLPEDEAVYIVDEHDGSIIKSCSYLNGDDNCTANYNVIGKNDQATFKAYIADSGADNKSDFTNIVTESNLVTINRTPWSIAYTTNSPIVNEGKKFSLKATANQEIPQGLTIYQIDITDGRVLANTGRSSQDESCQGDYTTYVECSTEFKYDKSHQYKAVLANENDENPPQTYTDLTGIRAESSVLTIKQLPFYITNFSLTGTADNRGYKGTINQPGTNYYSAIIDAKTNKILQLCNDSTTCETAWTYPNNYTDSKHDPSNGAKFVVGRWSENETLGPPYTGYEVPGYMYDIQASVSTSPSTPVTDSSWSIDHPNSLSNGSNPSQSCAQLCEADPINSVTGEFWVDKTDVTVKSSVPLTFARSYGVSKRSTLENLGYGWNSSLDLHLSAVGGTTLDMANSVILTQENGSTVTFIKDASGNFSTDLKTQGSLTKSGNFYIFTRKNKMIFKFDANGVLISATDLTGNTVSFTYTNGELVSLSNGKGQSLTIAWNSDRLISSVTDSDNKTVTYRYNAAKELSQVTFPDDSSEYYYYDTDHAMTSFKDRNGNITTNTYDDNKRVVQQADALGNVTGFSYDKYVTTITQPNGRVDKHYYNDDYQVYRLEKAVDTHDDYNEYYDYDSANNLLTTTYPDGGTAQATYDANGNVLQTKDRAGNITSFTYDNVGDVLTETNPNNKVMTYGYNASHNLVSSTDYAGNLTVFTVNSDGTNSKIKTPDNSETLINYNAQGLPDKTTDALGSVSSQTYNLDGQVLTTTDARGKTTSYAYDMANNVTSITYPNNSQELYEYDKNKNVIKITDRSGKVTTFVYDALNRQVQSTDPLNHILKQEYDSVGNITKKVDALNYTSTMEYDSLGRQISSTDAADNSTNYEYNAMGQVIKVTNPLNNSIQYGYDANGNIISTIDANGIKTSAVYNSENLPSKTYDVQKQPTSYTYDDNNNLLSTTLPNNTTETNTYDVMGQKTSYTDEDGKLKKYDYDALGRVIKFTNTDKGITNYSYDANGNLLTETRPDSSIETYAYSDTNQMTKDILSDETKEYAYDMADRLTQEKQGADTYDYTYDADGNIIGRTSSGGNSVSYTYTARDQVATITYPSNKVINYTYNKISEMTAASNSAIGSFSYVYDDAGNLSKATNPNGTSQTYSYNDGNQLTSINLKKGTAPIYSKNYSYDSSSSLLTSTNAEISKPQVVDITESYGYDSLMRLSSVESQSTNSGNYTYSNNGNLSSQFGKNQTYNQGNQLIETPDSTYTLDGRGNRVSEISKSTGTVKTQNTFNQSDKLTSVATGANTTSYSYDAEGLIKTRATNGTSKKFTWNIVGSLPELIDDGDYEYFYTVGNAPVAQINKSSNAITYLHSDDSGSILAATNSSGSKTGIYSYAPYGKTEIPSGVTDPNHTVTRFGYDGEWKDPTTGLYNLRARWYEPETGTFLSRDPLEAITNEAYSYASGNPLLYDDPTGLATEVNKANPISRYFKDIFDPITQLSSYSYDYQWDIGSAKNFTAQDAMRTFRNNPAQVFPFAVDNCPTFDQGAECYLHALTPSGTQDNGMVGAAHGDGHVSVENTCTSTTFTVTEPNTYITDPLHPFNNFKGYFDPPGSTITFSAKEVDGRIIFSQKTSPTGTWFAGAFGVNYLNKAHTTWQKQADNLEKLVKEKD